MELGAAESEAAKRWGYGRGTELNKHLWNYAQLRSVTTLWELDVYLFHHYKLIYKRKKEYYYI